MMIMVMMIMVMMVMMMIIMMMVMMVMMMMMISIEIVQRFHSLSIFSAGIMHCKMTTHQYSVTW